VTQATEKATEKKTTAKTATHTQLARDYAQRHYSDTMFTRGQWFRYDSGVWRPVHDYIVGLEIVRLLEGYESKGIRPTDPMCNSVEKILKKKMFVQEEQVDAADHLINMTNGVFDLGEQKLHPHSPNFYLTTQLPFEYDPNAKNPWWDWYLQTTFVQPRSSEYDPQLADFVQEIIGYSLTTNVSHHVMFWCIGEGANGKGVLFHILEKLGGNACMALNVGLLHREQYQLADLAGKRIAICSETPSTKYLVQDALIKALVAGDTMNVRKIRKDPFELHPTVHVWQSGNKLPDVADTSEGFWRRIRVIPFNYQFSDGEKILDLKEKLDKELSGIFNWAMLGLWRLRERGRFAIPDQVKAATEKYREESNPVVLFIKEKCYKTDKTEKMSNTTAVYEVYKTWCLDNNYKPLSSRKFKNEMERAGYYYDRDPEHRFYQQIALNGVEGLFH
jgi:putative DNA primase/helicase